MRFVIDMNLPPAWCAALERAGHRAEHWSAIGDGRATDETIMRWAREHDAIVFSHDLDFSAILASGGETTPSVIQVRAEDVMPESLKAIVFSAIEQFRTELAGGALVVVEPWRARCRVLPLRRA